MKKNATDGQTDKHRLPTTKNHATDEQNDRLPTDTII